MDGRSRYRFKQRSYRECLITRLIFLFPGWHRTNIACSKDIHLRKTVIDQQTLKIKLDAELELFAQLSNDDEKVADIIAIFISENPEILWQLEKYIHLEKWSDSARMVHKTKIQFGYFGLDDTLTDLNRWERELVLGNAKFNHVNSFNKLSNISHRVVALLLETRFQKPSTK